MSGRGKLILHAWGTKLYLYKNEVWHGNPDKPGAVGGSIVGANAEVITQGQLTQRITATRLALFGIFALAAPKKSGNQQIYLHVQGNDFAFLYQPVGIANVNLMMKSLNQTAMLINNRSLKLQAREADAAPANDE